MDLEPKVDVIINRDDRKKEERVSSGYWRFFIPSLTTISLVVYFVMSLMMNGDIMPITKRGFFCDDTTIKYPFNKQTIPLRILMIFALVMPGSIIKLCDIIMINLLKTKLQDRHKDGVINKRKKRRKISDEVNELNLEEEELLSSSTSDDKPIKRRQVLAPISDTDTDIDTVGESSASTNADFNHEDCDKEEEGDVTLFTRIPLDEGQDQLFKEQEISNNILRKHFSEFQLFFFGFSTTMLLTGIGKITLGRLRPHFFQRCQPDVDCSLPGNERRYIESFTCTNSGMGPRDYSYITTSWPSGESLSSGASY